MHLSKAKTNIERSVDMKRDLSEEDRDFYEQITINPQMEAHATWVFSAHSWSHFESTELHHSNAKLLRASAKGATA